MTGLSEKAVIPVETSSSSEKQSGGEGDQSGSNQMANRHMTNPLLTEQPKTAQQPVAATAEVVLEPARQNNAEQIVSQVRERLTQHELKQGIQHISLTLSPDNMGELKMNLNLQGQKLSVEIVTENKTVRDAIAQHTDGLKESLARQNITMESFDVTTGGKGSGSQGQNQNAWRELAKHQQQQQLWASPRGYNTAQASVLSGNAAYQRKTEHAMLDIHY